MFINTGYRRLQLSVIQNIVCIRALYNKQTLLLYHCARRINSKRA